MTNQEYCFNCGAPRPCGCGRSAYTADPGADEALELAKKAKGIAEEYERIMNMKVLCAWCGLVMRDGVEPVSHSICDPCAEKVKRQAVSQRDRIEFDEYVAAGGGEYGSAEAFAEAV